MQRIAKFIKLSLASLWANKSRSLLTMLGIIIGIGSVILMVSIGKGAEGLILSSIESFGNRSLFVQPGGGKSGGPPSITAIDKVKYKDYLALRTLNYVEDVTPLLVYSTILSRESQNQRIRLVGSNENYTKSVNTDVVLGRSISVEDVANAKRVVVLGYKNVDELFGDQNPVGKNVKMNGQNFLVIGVMGHQGTRFFQDFDQRVIMPITTMKNTIFGVDYVSTVMMNAKNSKDMAQNMEDIRAFLRKRHALFNPENDPEKDDFKVISQEDGAKSFQQISDTLTIFLVAIAAISLLVGGIGIMNIMLVAVSERTREIGLRKAVGANNSDIMLQFLIEAVVLTFVAGLLGVVGGISMSWLIAKVLVNFQPAWKFVVTWDSVTVSFLVSVAIGVVFGIYPARSASKLNPIACLRTE